ncbi:MAG: hypothetical protein COB15_11820 [Flavobacteriales bacterium]|nr:MAG: hypothetical protein COB15_11820 [Flavobacteriales bacterium]
MRLLKKLTLIKLKKLLFLVAFLCFAINSFSTHLVGGNIAYKYLGDTDGDGSFNYLITFQTFLDCNSPFWLTGFPEGSLDVGIYEGGSSPSGNLPLIQIATMPLIDSNSIIPVPTNGCLVGQSVCLYEAIYEVEVDLPLSFQGYHLFYDRCCRTGSVINLNNPGDQGLSFHAFISPTLVNNSSPVFSDVPVPFLCENDTVSILNTATDPDGDLLQFSFVDPYRGFGNQTAPAPALPSPLPWPIPSVNWLNTSYDMNNPFGAFGHAFINGTTGLTEYMAPLIGDYVVAIEIREFRFGNLIGITRRDIQIVVITCPSNPPPNLSTSGGSGTTQYVLDECDSLSFPIIFTDNDGDSLTLSTSGQIFDPAFITPTATIDSLVLGDSTVTANFNWQTDCGTAQTLPYLFTVSATDNGCPPKTTNVVYQVTVNPPTSPDSILGPPLICQNSNGTYSVDTILGSSFNWSVTNGTINSGQGSSSINVNWATVGAGTVSVNAISECGCPSALIDTVVTIIPSPATEAGNDTTLCLGDTLQIGGSPTGPLGTLFSWSPSFNMDNNSLANPSVWPSTTTDYIVVVDNGTCMSIDTINVIVGSATISGGGDASICIGDAVQLNASGGTGYVWTPSTGLSDPSIANPIANPVLTTDYIVTITDSLGCSGIDTVTVIVDVLPSIVMDNDTSVCLGGCVQISASGGSSYTWTPGGTLSDSTIASPTACPTTTTTYYVTGFSGMGMCSIQDSLTVIISPAPVITTNNDTDVCEGVCVQLNTVGGTSYIWTPSTGLSNDTIANPLACPTTTTTYIVTGTDATGCSSSDTITITINPLPTIDPGNNQGICVVGSVVIGGTPTGPVGATFVWSPGASLNDNTLANPTANPIVTTTYTVTVTDTNGCVDFDVTTVSINPLPTVEAGNNTSMCEGESLTIGGSPTGPNSASYLWTPGVSLDDNTLANPTATPALTTNYIVTVTDSNGCVEVDTILITINSLPVITTNNDTAFCIGSCVQLNASGGTDYVWSPATNLSNNIIANPIACPIITTNYIVTVTDTNTCVDTAAILITVNALPSVNAGSNQSICIGDSLVIGGSPTGPAGSSYLWTPSTTIIEDTLANPTVFPSSLTTYTVTVTDSNGCVDLSTVDVDVNFLPLIDAGNDTNICRGDSVQLIATGGLNYFWTPGITLTDSTMPNPFAFPNDTTEYILFVEDINGCSALDTVKVNVIELPTISTGSSLSGCLGDSVQLNATGGDTYAWSPGNSLTDSNIANPIAFPNSTTTYTVIGTDTMECSNTDSVLVTVNELIVIDLADTIICIGEALQLTVNGPTGASYLWSPGTDLSNTSIFNPITTTLVTISYFVTVTDTNGCSDSTSITVVAELAPTADFSTVTSPACEGIVAEFTNLSIGASSYLWSFGDGDQSTEINTTHTFAYGSPYTTILTAYSLGLCSDTASWVINTGNFEDYFNITPPTVLTPNRDGLNDLFKVDLPYGIGNCVDITVFNRWGVKIYDSHGQNSGWDGRTTAGEKVPEGTYFYIIEINGITKKGSLTLID